MYEMANPNESNLYLVLGVSSDATPDELKQAFRRLALRFHPDKNPDAADEFKAVNHAYEILGDPQRRRVYDRYGEMGVSMMDGVGGNLFNPDISDMLCTVSLTLTLLTSLVIIFLSFLSVRVDHQVEWEYAVVFIPLFIVDGFLVAFMVQKGLTEYQVDTEELLSEDDQEALAALPLEDREAQRAAWLRRHRRVSFLRSVMSLVYVGLFILFQVFVVLRLDRIVTWPIAVVFLPWFIMEAFHVVLASFECIHILITEQADFDVSPWWAWCQLYALVIYDTFWWMALRILQAILLALRIDETITCHWAVVFIPVYCVGLHYLVALARLRWRIRSFRQQVTGKTDLHAVFYLGLTAFIVMGTLAYAFIGLLVRRLEVPGSVRVAILLVPVFIVVSFVFLGVCCCMPCVACSMRADFSVPRSSATMAVVPSGRRITLPNTALESSSSHSQSIPPSSQTSLAP
ncbi:hypothetical protein H4R34_004427 [Dimargaris verticillata]|uniref:J domain-containing protein n=1 Tax=Dimargaris verticillata TaxID=2761393 RepID=A0A9W8AYY5_9FUNG|nr:hypothetical protein H4R34_004427 [Dimargaris verticillata]